LSPLSLFWYDTTADAETPTLHAPVGIAIAVNKKSALPPENVLFRLWNRRDIPTLARLARELYAHIESIDPVWRTSPGAEDHLRVHLLDLFTTRHATSYVACNGQGIVGFITGSITQRPPVILPRRDGLIDNAYVLPRWRRKGIGTRLCRMLLSWFTEQGVAEVRIHYQVSNRDANRFWERLGFRPWTIQAHLWLTGRNGPEA
jgi:ribosomal protein S18 acetylase RimI-like enzyme